MTREPNEMKGIKQKTEPSVDAPRFVQERIGYEIVRALCKSLLLAFLDVLR